MNSLENIRRHDEVMKGLGLNRDWTPKVDNDEEIQLTWRSYAKLVYDSETNEMKQIPLTDEEIATRTKLKEKNE
jgi:hypothetical protein